MRAALATVLFIALVMFLIESGPSGCGGAASDSPPNVEGIYDCESGCSGVCTFEDGLEIVQTGDQFVGTTTNSSFDGEVNNDGEFSFDGENVLGENISCSGQFVGGTAVGDCTIDGFDCPQVTYQRR